MKVVYAATFLLACEGALGFTSGSSRNSITTRCYLNVDGTELEEGQINAANNFILIKVADAIEKTDTGILLTGKAQVQKTEGTVVSVGPGKTHPETGEPFEIPVEAGEGVVYGQYDGTEIDIDGVTHSLIRDDDILVKFSGDELTIEAADVIRDNVLVFVDQSGSSTEGGLLLGTTKKSESRPSTGKVVKVGPGLFDKGLEVAPGDTIKFRDFAGGEVEIEGEEYSVVKVSDILAKF
jgi:chaperonin GroES